MNRIYDKNSTVNFGSHAVDFLSQLLKYDQEPRGYGCRERNSIEDQIERTMSAVSTLAMILNSKGILTDKEVFEVFGLDERDVERRQLRIAE